MKSIYKIHVKHYAPKDSHMSIETFLLADSDENIYSFVDKLSYGQYTDIDEEGELYEIYDEDYNIVGEETFKEKMLRVKGRLFDDDFEPEDLHYGCTLYGWEKVKDSPSQVEVNLLKSLGVLEEV